MKPSDFQTPKLVPITALREDPENPRTEEVRMQAAIERSIRGVGFVLPLVTTEDGMLLSGHKRLRAAKAIGLTEVPVLEAHVKHLDWLVVNIMFNRATNDMLRSQTPEQVVQAYATDDLTPVPDAEDKFPCLAPSWRPTQDMIRANPEFNAGSYAAARRLANLGFLLPLVVCGERVLNGAGRLFLYSENEWPSVPVIEVAPERAELARRLLNGLTMEFDLDRVGDHLRMNSFRRTKGTKAVLGNAYTWFARKPGTPSKAFSIGDPAKLRAWTAVYGTKIVDFGAGRLTEAGIARRAGIHVSAFEPYCTKPDADIVDTERSREVTRAFLQDVASGMTWHSVLGSAILNSIPFLEDRRHVLRIIASLCQPHGTFFTQCISNFNATWQAIEDSKDHGGEDKLAKLQVRPGFVLNFDDRTTLGVEAKVKIQKFHTSAEIRELLEEFWGNVQVWDAEGYVYAAAKFPKEIDPEELEASLRFEFDLPHPDGQRLGLAEEAVDAWRKSGRLKVKQLNHGVDIDSEPCEGVRDEGNRTDGPLQLAGHGA